jgi:hypothetical protein
MSMSWTDLNSFKSFTPVIEVDEHYSFPIHVGTSLLEFLQAKAQENLRYHSQNDHEVSPILQAFRLDLSSRDIFDSVLGTSDPRR